MKDSKPVPEPERAPDNTWLIFLNLGWIIAGTMTLTLLGGYWLDTHFGTQPIFTIIGVVLGLAGCVYSFYRAVAKAASQETRKPGK